MEEVITTVIGLLGGLLLSAAFWYWTVHVLRPEIDFSSGMARRTDDTGRTVYSAKIRNAGRRRGVIDVTVEASLRFPTRAFRPGAPDDSISSFPIAVRTGSFYRLAPGRERLVTMDLATTLLDDDARDFISALYPIPTQRAGLDLEALLRRSPGVHVELHVLCFDEWSGSRRYYKSRPFTADSIRAGHFAGMTVVP